MNITFDKALLWILPCLFVVSIAYYLGYWGTLDIDAFNYYGVQDLIKGAAAPISFRTARMVVGAIGLILLISLGPLLIKMQPRYLTLAISVMTLFVAAFVYSVVVKQQSIMIPPFVVLWEVRLMYFVLIAIALYNFLKANQFGHSLVAMIDGEVGIDDLEKIFYKMVGLMILLVLPISSFLEGHKKAWQLQNNLAFDYINTAEADTSVFLRKKTLVKFAGKAGEYYFFISANGGQRIVVPSSQFKGLFLYHFDKSDSASVKQYRAMDHANRLPSKRPSVAFKKQTRRDSLHTRPVAQDRLKI